MDLVLKRRGKKLAKDHAKIFSGEFWSGKQGVKLGLIDGIGDLYSVMKKEYGDDIVFTYIKKEESWIQKKISMLINYERLVDYCLEKIEQKIHLNRFGL